MKMRVLCLTDFAVRSGRWLWDYLPGNSDQVDFVTVPVNRRLARFSNALAYLLAASCQLLQVRERLHQGKYDLVVAWETKNGFPYALGRRLTGQRHPPMVILAFGDRGLPARFPGLMRYALQAVDGLTVPSTAEAAAYAVCFDLPRGRVIVCPNGAYDVPEGYRLLAHSGLQSIGEEYIFAGGYSRRDFATLIEAVRGVDVPLRIVAPLSRRSLPTLPSNVTWLEPQPYPVYLRLMLGARLVVIPLKAVPYSVGLVDLLTAMAGGKAIVLSCSGGAAEYLQDGVDGRLVRPGDAVELRQVLIDLLRRPSEIQRLGLAARQKYEQNYTYEAFARRTYEAICRITAG